MKINLGSDSNLNLDSLSQNDKNIAVKKYRKVYTTPFVIQTY